MIFPRLRVKRVPELVQLSEADCGLVCLAMILNFYGRKTTVSELREQYGVGRDGISALGIVRAARRYGMRVRAVSLQQNDLRFIKLPAIVHWEFDHFLVVERWSLRYVDVVDPSGGRRRLTHTEFDEGFTGVVITLEPGATFDRRSSPSRRTLAAYVRCYVQQSPSTFLQLLAVSLFMLLIGLSVRQLLAHKPGIVAIALEQFVM